MGDLAVTNSKALMAPEELQVLKDSMFKGFTDPEIKFSMAVANKLNLSPLLRQIHFVKRKDHQRNTDIIVPQTGIDGFRLIAERTGNYAGSDDPVFEYNSEGKPIKATCTVWKLLKNQKVGFTASARFEEYYPGEKMGFMWRSKPHIMLGKCSEAQALRKAFPAELSSVYADEEMHVADSVEQKASLIQEKILKTPELKTHEFEAVVVSTYDLFNTPMPASSPHKDKVLGQLSVKEIKAYMDSIRKAHSEIKKPLSIIWEEFLEKCELYLSEVGDA